MDIDLKGAEKIHDNFDPCNYLFVDVPSMEEVERRLKKRGIHSEEEVGKLLKSAEEDVAISKKLSYYEHIVNDKLEDTIKQVVEKAKKFYPEVKFN